MMLIIPVVATLLSQAGGQEVHALNDIDPFFIHKHHDANPIVARSLSCPEIRSFGIDYYRHVPAYLAKITPDDIKSLT